MKIGQKIGRYRVEGLVGTGAMGEVYRAYDPVIDRPVAIKILRSELIADSGSMQWLQRFRREARAAGRRSHPNIVAIWDFGEDNGTPFLAMEYVDGRRLDEVIKSSGRLETSRAVVIITQVLSALGFAHENGIIHRDVKPANIIVLPNDGVKIADFGIARVDTSEFTFAGDLMGTPAYMAPEQIAGAPVDLRIDLFAAGVILFEMLTGVKPFRGNSITEIMRVMKTRGSEDIKVLNPAVPDALRRVIAKSIAFDPSERYTDAAAFSKAISGAVRASTGEPQVTNTSAPEGSLTETKIMPIAGAVPNLPGEAFLHPDLSREIERDLATYIGPMAGNALRRAARQTNDLPTLYELLGKQINTPKDRAEFLARGYQRADAGFGRPRASPSPQPEGAAEPNLDRPVISPSPASIVAIETDLIRYIGPIAIILVKRELKKFESLTDFCVLLAAHIANEKDRDAFLDAHGAK
jgi:serine/threonine protein kinase